MSLYNETNGEAIYPTPILGVVASSTMRPRSWHARSGVREEIVLFGEAFGELGGSEYLKALHRKVRGSRDPGPR